MARQWRDAGIAPATVKDGLRTLIKDGHPDALQLVDIEIGQIVRLSDLSVDRTTVPIGGAVTFSVQLDLAPTSSTRGDALIDYRVHHAGARAQRRPKVFKLSRRTLEPGQPLVIKREHRFRT